MIKGMANLTSSDGTTAQFAVGTNYEVGGTAWVYCKSTAATIAAYSICSGANYGVMEAATTTTAAALGTSGGAACLPQFDVGASEYFWALVGPWGTVNPVDETTTFKILSANTTAGNLLYTTGTAGVVDDASTTALVGVTITTTSTTQAATPCFSWRRIGFVR
jgi:hypothetical protein